MIGVCGNANGELGMVKLNNIWDFRMKFLLCYQYSNNTDREENSISSLLCGYGTH